MRLFLLLSVIAALAVICAGLGSIVDPFVLLVFGWIRFLARVMGQVTLNPIALLTGLLSLLILTLGLHSFAGWLYRQKGIPDESRVWRWRWTGALVGVILLMFVAGIAMIGVTHQTTWMIRSPEPFFNSSPVRMAVAKSQSQVNLKQMSLSVLNHFDQEGEKNPLGVLVDQDGRLLHGWMTRVLPQMDNEPLYKRIDLSKPWDHPDNKAAMSKEFKPFLHTLLDKREEGGYALSHYAGNVHVLGYRMPPYPGGFTDGASQTIMIGEVSTNLKPWGHPVGWRDFALGVQRSPDGFGGPIKGMTQVAMGDGSVKTIRNTVSLATLKAASTPAGNDTLGDDW